MLTMKQSKSRSLALVALGVLFVGLLWGASLPRGSDQFRDSIPPWGLAEDYEQWRQAAKELGAICGYRDPSRINDFYGVAVDWAQYEQLHSLEEDLVVVADPARAKALTDLASRIATEGAFETQEAFEAALRAALGEEVVLPPLQQLGQHDPVPVEE